MGLATFIGGIHPYEGKELSEDKPIKVLEPLQGEIMVYPLSQHIGAPAKPLVAKGDHVLKAQRSAHRLRLEEGRFNPCAVCAFQSARSLSGTYGIKDI